MAALVVADGHHHPAASQVVAVVANHHPVAHVVAVVANHHPVAALVVAVVANHHPVAALVVAVVANNHPVAALVVVCPNLFVGLTAAVAVQERPFHHPSPVELTVALVLGSVELQDHHQPGPTTPHPC